MTETTQTEVSHETQKREWAEGAPAEMSRLIGEHKKDMKGFDEKKVRKGYILDLIRTDDIGAFNAARLNLARRPEIAFGQKGKILARINWELAQAATPKSILSWLKKAGAAIQVIEWRSEGDIEASRKIWEDIVFANVRVMMNANLDGAGNAHKEFRRFQDEMRKRNQAGS